AREMRRHPLLGRERERRLALEIEARSRDLWTALLSPLDIARPIATMVGERLPSARPALRRVERAAAVAATQPGPEGRKALERAARKAAEKLHAVDVDHRVADEVAALVAAAARDPALAVPPLGAAARTRAFRREAAAVAAAAREVAGARARFVKANIGLVFHVAGRYHSTAMSPADFVQEGMFGLMKAVGRFDPRRGLRFSTYATWWIRHAVGRALSDKSRLVRLPVHLQEAQQRLQAIRRDLRRELGREPTRDELARAGGVTPRRLEYIREVNAAVQLRLDEPFGEEGDRARSEVFVSPAEPAIDPTESLHREAMALALERHMQELSPMEREVLRRRFALGDLERESTLQEIATDHGLSRERIRQIQVSALRKLRARLAA
ncbi:MAG TPA: sigma-70 family RNA polymerase sigma factor, partial [Kofleriaceae bacterium]|nr:sigma-70 family RNA polymerase sigma factor [Kofleriaceae bacterium]